MMTPKTAHRPDAPPSRIACKCGTPPMFTSTGGMYCPLHLKHEAVKLADIATALGNLCAYGGKIPVFYSLAERMVRTKAEAKKVVEENNLIDDDRRAVLVMAFTSAVDAAYLPILDDYEGRENAVLAFRGSAAIAAGIEVFENGQRNGATISTALFGDPPHIPNSKLKFIIGLIQDVQTRIGRQEWRDLFPANHPYAETVNRKICDCPQCRGQAAPAEKIEPWTSAEAKRRFLETAIGLGAKA